MPQYKSIRWLLLCLIANRSIAMPSFSSMVSTPELTAAVGASWANAGNTTIHVSGFETDALNVRHISNDAIWRFGIGTDIWQETLAQRAYFNELALQLNFYTSSATIKGSVWQYQLPQFNNYAFRAPVTNSRLMLDAKPGLFTWHDVSSYLIGGIGAGWNSIGYYETITGAGVPVGSNYVLERNTNINATYNLGAGLKHRFTSHLTGVLEYEYTYLGRMAPMMNSNTPATLIKPPYFTLSTQNLLVGINWQV